MFDSLRDRWEHMAVRERRLVALLGITGIIVLFLFVGLRIRKGLDAIADENAAMRTALQRVDEHRDELAAGGGVKEDVLAQIGTEAPQLGTLLETIGRDTGVTIRDSTAKAPVLRGKFQERSVQITASNVTVPQLVDFLQRIETRPTVVTQRIKLHRSAADKERFDRVEITVATWERTAKTSKSEAKGKADAGAPRAEEKLP